MKKSEAEARRRIESALYLIEQAQQTLQQAAALLSRVRESDHHWKLVGKGYDQVHDLWRKVRAKTAARDFRMDSDWERTNPES